VYTKQDISRQKQAFWTAFGKYMQPILSSDGEAINWINYKTGNKQYSIKMEVDSQLACIALVVYHPDPEIRQESFERLKQLKPIFEETMGDLDWDWKPEQTDEQGRVIGVVGKKITGINFFQSSDWATIISFLKPRLIALDEFWSMVRYDLARD
jgi:hypothetical protein